MKVSSSHLLRNISLFFSSAACNNFGSESIQKCYQNIGDIFKLLKQIPGCILDTSMASDDQLSKAVVQLDCSIKECTNLFENCHPLASKMYLILWMQPEHVCSGQCYKEREFNFLVNHYAVVKVLQADGLTARIQNCVLEIFQRLLNCHQSLRGGLSSSTVENCIQEVMNIGCDTISTFIKNAVNDKKGSHGLSSERLIKIAGCLGLQSNEKILIEAVALKKLKDNAAENESEADHFEDLISLVAHMHHFVKLKQSQSCTPFPIPADFCCPLSLELMADPVIVSSGQTYEHAFIKKWLDLGLTVCPKTMQSLNHTNLIPNYTSKALIANWCENNNLKLPEPMEHVNGNFSLFSWGDVKVRKLVEDLKSNSKESLLEATSQLRLFLKQYKDYRIQITYFGVIRLLVNLLHSDVPEIQENAVASLLYMAIDNDNKTAIADEDSIEPLIHVLQVGNPEARENSAATLFCLSMIHVNKLRIGRLGGIVPLVELLHKGTPQGKNNAAIVLFNLSICHENRVKIVQTGGVRVLVELVSDPAIGMVDKAVVVLASLAKIPEGRVAIGQARGIPALVNTLELGSARAKGFAVSALLQLCTFSSRLCAIAIKEAVVPSLVALSRSGTGTPRAKEKAVSLLHYIRSQLGNIEFRIVP